ncbi:hypothetical protein GCM10020331_016330 [Ectobacillus funiculus]
MATFDFWTSLKAHPSEYQAAKAKKTPKKIKKTRDICRVFYFWIMLEEVDKRLQFHRQINMMNTNMLWNINPSRRKIQYTFYCSFSPIDLLLTALHEKAPLKLLP